MVLSVIRGPNVNITGHSFSLMEGGGAGGGEGGGGGGGGVGGGERECYQC